MSSPQKSNVDCMCWDIGATGATGAQQFAEARDNFAAFVDHWKGQMGHACHVLNPPVAMLALALAGASHRNHC